MRELYGFDGIIHVSRIVFLEWVALLSVLIFCLLLGLRLDAHIAWSYWFVSLPLWLFYVCVALSAALLWQGFSGNLFRLDLTDLLGKQRKFLTPLLILCAVAVTLTHALLILNLDRTTNYSYAIAFVPLLIAGAIVAASLWYVLKRIIRMARRKGGRRRALNEVLDEFRKDHDEMELKRLAHFVDVESGRGGSGPQLLIRGSVFPGLASAPWHERVRFEWVRELEAATDLIRDEVMKVVQSRDGFKQYFYPGVGNESWQSLMFYKGGRRMEENCALCPETVRRIEQMPGGTVREAMISLLEPKAHIRPHRDSGNQLLTCHLGLRIPSDCAIRVGSETRNWSEGQCLIFDTTFEHEAWNKSDEPRVVLLVDFWHPDLTNVEREFLMAVTKRIGHW
jgi:hypothetical protein